MVCVVHSSGDIMYTRTGDYFGKTRKIFITTRALMRVILTIATRLLMINNLIRTLYNLTDGLYVAQLSAGRLCGNRVYLAVEFSVFISLRMGISVGATALIAATGQGK